MKKSHTRPVLAWLFLASLLTPAFDCFGAPKDYKYEGAWEGALTSSNTPSEGAEWKWHSGPELRLSFSGGRVVVFTKRNGDWIEAKPGSFTMASVDTNAVVVAITSGEDTDGIVWVETWSMALTPIDDTHLEILWQRQVKNKGLDVSNSSAVFGAVGYGVLARIDKGNKVDKSK